MTRVVFTLLASLNITVAWAQSDDKAADAVAEIQRLYKDVSEKLARDSTQTPEFYRTDVVVGANDKLWATIGTYQRDAQFYFEITDEGRAERLVKAHEKITFGNRKFFAEYLFAPKGELVFYMISPAVKDAAVGDPLEYVNQPQLEVCCYYAKGKLIRLVRGAGNAAEMKQRGFLAREKELAQDGQARAKLLKAIFAASVKLN